jgi:hypothetical protein
MKMIQLTMGRSVAVDDDDYEALSKFRWQAKNPRKDTYYAARSIRLSNGRQKTVGMHRIITNCPDGYDVDHIDGDGLNNCKNNLRVVTRRQNLQNRHSKTTSNYVGVSFDKNERKWVAYIRIENKMVKLGRFTDEANAANAYLRKVRELGETPLSDITLSNAPKSAQRTEGK